MVVTLIRASHIRSVTLPSKPSGRYYVTEEDADGRTQRLVSLEGEAGQWTLRAERGMVLLRENGAPADWIALPAERFCIIDLKDAETGERAQLFAEPSTQERREFAKYAVSGDCELSIGRTGENQIFFHNQYVSSRHALLSLRNGEWSIVDAQSRNGTFVNGVKIATARLKPGDSIFIMGLKIIVGRGFLSLNNPDYAVTVAAGGPLTPLNTPLSERMAPPEPAAEDSPYYRSPRFRRSIVREELRVDAPPAPQRPDETPLALLLGPALTMGMTAVVMAVLAVSNLMNGTATMSTTLPTLVMSFSMLCGTLLWPLLTKRSEKKRRIALENQRMQKYRSYLDRIQGQIFDIAAVQKEILLENFPPLTELAQAVQLRRPPLWERTPGQEDFLELRLGLGSRPLWLDLKFPDRRFTLEQDVLSNDLWRLVDAPKQLEGVPVTWSLLRDRIGGITGAQNQQFAAALLLQTAALHSCDEVKLVLLTDPERTANWQFARWLPHLWDEETGMRGFACGGDEIKALSAQLERILAQRGGAGQKKFWPRYVVLADGLEQAARAAFLRLISASAQDLGFSVLYLADQVRSLPKECTKVVELDETGGTLRGRDDFSEDRMPFQKDETASLNLLDMSVQMGNIFLDTGREEYILPGFLTFLELFGVGKTEHLNALTRWKENNPANTLQAPVGVGTDGQTFFLDLHEKFHGPHGLVAGMTGSGKSEFIITYILSMAVNYHPDEVAFILIDYKGGGLAGAFEDAEQGIRLPHLAGTITNLDGTAVKRSLISIQSELRRRQAIFNEARQISGEGTIDIYKYQKLYRMGLVKEPVPHLFIISDEFAELKTQQQEFMDQLISAARIGRSLGVHLILATQKPSGVVDDQIWSNSRFRVCLKVQEKADSMDMIKRPDAAELTETGRFYLQVGFHELFALGQSAWSGAPYEPADRYQQSRDEQILVLDNLGRTMAQAKPKAARRKEGQEVSQVVSIVRYLSHVAREEQISVRRLWLPPIPADIYLDDLREKYGYQPDPFGLNPVVGEYDDPFNQRQGLLTLPLEQGNAVLYGSMGSGKNTFLNTVLCGLLRDYDAARLNIYLVDLGEETLKAFQDAPQVGDVLFAGDEEQIHSLMNMLSEELARRRSLLTAWDGDYGSYCRGGGSDLPRILLAVRNYGAFSELFEQDEEALLKLSQDGSKYGIHILLTANTPNAVRYRVLQNYKQLVALQLNDRSDYIGLLGSTDGVFPSKIKGRGLIQLQDRFYEFQTAQAMPELNQEKLRGMCQKLLARGGTAARHVPVLPQRVGRDFLAREGGTLENLPVGVEKSSLNLARLDLSRNVCTLLLAEDTEDYVPAAQGIAETAAALPGLHVTVLDPQRLFFEAGEDGYDYHAAEPEEAVRAVFAELVRRNRAYKQEGVTRFDPMLYVLVGISALLESLSDDGKDKLKVLLEKAECPYAVRFILCDSARNLSSLTADAWYKRHISGGEGLWAGNGLANQYLFKLSKIPSELYGEIEDGFGFLLRRSKPVLIKLPEPWRAEGGEADGQDPA